MEKKTAEAEALKRFPEYPTHSKDAQKRQRRYQDRFIEGAMWAAALSPLPQEGQDGWVRVEDEEAPEHETVMVVIGEDTVLMGIYNSNKEWAIYYSDGRHGEDIDRPVTHWRKLPAPPTNQL